MFRARMRSAHLGFHIPPSPFHNPLPPHTLPPRRSINIPTALLPPLIFSALLVALWSYKCAMLVLFQNRIIYMPSMPPFARSERIADYAAACRPVAWRQDRISAPDGPALAVAVGEIATPPEGAGAGAGVDRVVVIYFQGNGSSLPPRLPALSSVLKLLPPPAPRYTLLALSYRGYWTSSGRPSEPGLVLDAAAVLAHAARAYPPGPRTRFVLWGQSLGASVALAAAANATSSPTGPSPTGPGPPRLHGLVLETPFLSVRAMLQALYPQPWLPYRHLAPFLRNHWDAADALHRLASSSPSQPSPSQPSSPPSSASPPSASSPPPPSASPPPPILILQAGRDELVPAHHAVALERMCLDLGLGARRVEVAGAFHTDVLAKASGRAAVAEFLRGVGA